MIVTANAVIEVAMYLSSKLSSFTLKVVHCVFYMVISSALYAEEKPVPNQIDGITKVNAEGVIELAEKFHDLIIVDSRINGDRHKGYLESSMSLPDIDTNCKSLSKIIPTFKSPALFYCNGVKCGRSVVAVNIAKKCGYKNIYWFRGGFEVWLEKGFPFVKQ